MRPVQQIVLGLLVAIGLLVLLQWWVSQGADSQITDSQGTAPGQRETHRQRPPDTGAGGRRILKDLDGVASGFDLAVRLDQLPGGCAPVLAVGIGGAIRIVTPASLSRTPGSVKWPRVGVLLPRARLRELSATERASLLAIWTRLAGAARLEAAAIRLHGCEARPGEIELLLRWLR